MNRGNLDDLAAFAAVAAEGSFTRAATRLGMSQSALSHAMKALERRLGLKLLARTTRSVSTTVAGESLLATLRPALEDIERSLAGLRDARDRPAGTLRLTMVRQAADVVVRPMLRGFLASHPAIHVELHLDDRFTDIVAERFDGGIRLGEKLEKDMVAVRVGPDVRAALVASPAYLEGRTTPTSPRELTEHRCLTYRFPTADGIHAWEFFKHGRRVEVRVEGPLALNDGDLLVAAAIDGLGVAWVFEDQVRAHLQAGTLVRLLQEWCPPMPGYHLYYPDRQVSAPMRAFIDAVRYRGT